MLKVDLVSDAELVKLDSEYCSYGDTVHYIEPPKVFRNAEGSFVYDSQDTQYLDLQMWYSACNFGYKNERINNAAKEQHEYYASACISISK